MLVGPGVSLFFVVCCCSRCVIEVEDNCHLSWKGHTKVDSMLEAWILPNASNSQRRRKSNNCYA